MKKEYVKPQNRVVVLKDKLMEGPTMSQGPGTDDPAAKQMNLDDFDSDSSSDVWED